MNPSRWLGLAASPSFAAMAIASAIHAADPLAIVCGSSVGPLGSMTAMYALMSLFHAGPWLRLLERRRVEAA